MYYNINKEGNNNSSSITTVQVEIEDKKEYNSKEKGINKLLDQNSMSTDIKESKLSENKDSLSHVSKDDQLVEDNHNFNNSHSKINVGNEPQNLTLEQQQAFIEFQLMSQNLDFEDDYDFGLNYHDVPEYDVREKLQSLNAKLASEPLPPSSEHRNSKVAFKDELVSLVAPPDDYEDSEIEFEENEQYYSPSNIFIPQMEPTAIEVFITKDSLETLESDKQLTLTKENKLNNEQNISEINDQNNSKVELSDNMVLSRGGKFQYIGTSEIIDTSNHPSGNEDKLLNRNKVKQMKVRPLSAQVTKRYNKGTENLTFSDSSYRPSSQLQKQNGIPPVDKEALRRQKDRKKKQEEEQLERDKEEQNMKNEINSRSFETWLQIKQKQRREELGRKRKEEEEELEKKERLQEERKYLAQELELELIRKLDRDKKKEEKLKLYRLKEIEETVIVNSDTDCDKAFKDWLKKKHKDYKNKVREDKRNARLARLTMRQSRKSHDLAQALQQSTSSRYLNLY